MKKFNILILVFYFLFFNNLFSQDNLVLNPSFELTNLNIPCSPNNNYLNFPATDWQWASGGTTDLFSMSLNPLCLMHPLNLGAANQLPHTGQNYVGMYNRYDTDYREYVRGNLSSSVLVGYKYIIQFYVSIGEISNVGSNNIGLKFINSSDLMYSGVEYIPLQPDVNYDGVPLVDKEQWVLLSFEFYPVTPNQQSFIIGNFFSNSDTTLSPPNVSLPATYFLIDDVNIYIEPPFFDIINEICQGGTYVFPTTSSNGHTGVWFPEFNNQETTTYTFIPDDPNYPKIEKTIEIIPTVYPTFPTFGPLCSNVTNFSLPTESNEGIQGYWDSNFNPSKSSYTFTPTSGKCAAEVTINIEIYDTFDFDVKYYCENGQFFLEVFNLKIPEENIINYDWSINNNSVNVNNKIINVSNFSDFINSSNTFEVKVTEKMGCSNIISLQIDDSRFCTVPRGISPNNDGLNDNLKLNFYDVIDLKIFNRFGTEVYTKNNYVDQWFGQSNSGDQLPSGTYFYEISTKSGDSYTGWIQLTY